MRRGHEARKIRREAAELRAVERAKRTDKQQICRLALSYPIGESKKEIARLTARIAKKEKKDEAKR